MLAHKALYSASRRVRMPLVRQQYPELFQITLGIAEEENAPARLDLAHALSVLKSVAVKEGYVLRMLAASAPRHRTSSDPD